MALSVSYNSGGEQRDFTLVGKLKGATHSLLGQSFIINARMTRLECNINRSFKTVGHPS